MVLPEEEKRLVPSVLKNVEYCWSRKRVKISITDVTTYQKRNLCLLALTVKSDDIKKIRKDLGLEVMPGKMNLNITVCQKKN